MNGKLEISEAVVCDVCGQDGAVELGEGNYCPDCYSNAASSCAGGGHAQRVVS